MTGAKRQAEEHIPPLSREIGVAVIVNRPSAQASLFSRVKDKDLAEWAGKFDCRSWSQPLYILGCPAVTCAIPATSTANHVIDNMAAAIGRLTDAAMRRTMADYLQNR